MSEINDVPLYQIIGAPLLALVQGETQAAHATARFIQEIGFERTEPEGSDPLQYGRLKMVTFRYNKTSVGGNQTQLEVEIPVLSIVPIPALQIREAAIDFSVEINSIVELDAPTAINVPKITKQESSLEPKMVAFKAGLAREDSKSAMKINIKVGQADTPVGLLTLFRVLDQGIRSHEVQTPPNPTAQT
ncbi:MAG: DUF2589 domain-containing protein [Chroococcales cyanobacterium]